MDEGWMRCISFPGWLWLRAKNVPWLEINQIYTHIGTFGVEELVAFKSKVSTSPSLKGPSLLHQKTFFGRRLEEEEMDETKMKFRQQKAN